MSSAITSAGDSAFALHQSQGTALVIDTFILANINGVDPTAAIDPAEGLPDAADIVHEYTIPEEYRGYINPNQVVYSMMLGSDIGDFSFNWVGLYSSADDVVVAITTVPTLTKSQTVGTTMGNALTRNFMLEYAGAAAITTITVEASTWQIDFTARLKGIDERERLSNLDIYGGACFFDDGFLVVNEAGAISVQPGVGYVEGIRITLDAVQAISPTLPAEVFLDVALQPQGSDRVAVARIVFAAPGDYVDSTNDAHYGQQLAEISAGGVVTDVRPKTAGGEMTRLFAAKDHTHAGYAATVHPHLAKHITDLLTTPRSYTAVQAYTPVALTVSGGATTWDLTAAPVAEITLAADVTLTVTNAVPGSSPILRVIQDATGGWSLIWPSSWLWADGVAHDVSTDAGAVDAVQLDVGSDGTVYAQGTSGYAEVS